MVVGTPHWLVEFEFQVVTVLRTLGRSDPPGCDFQLAQMGGGKLLDGDALSLALGLGPDDRIRSGT